MEATRQAQVYGVRRSRSFEEAAAKFVLENQHKRSLDDDISQLKLLMPWIGREALDCLHLGTLQPWIERRRREGKATGTINHGLKIVRRILNLAASEWVDELGLTWLLAAPKIKLLSDQHKQPPYPLSWEEQGRLFKELPDYLAQGGQHGLPRPGDLLAAVGVGSCRAASCVERLHLGSGSPHMLRRRHL
jgi:hypothetical protein